MQLGSILDWKRAETKRRDISAFRSKNVTKMIIFAAENLIKFQTIFITLFRHGQTTFFRIKHDEAFVFLRHDLLFGFWDIFDWNFRPEFELLEQCPCMQQYIRDGCRQLWWLSSYCLTKFAIVFYFWLSFSQIKTEIKQA